MTVVDDDALVILDDVVVVVLDIAAMEVNRFLPVHLATATVLSTPLCTRIALPGKFTAMFVPLPLALLVMPAAIRSRNVAIQWSTSVRASHE